ncbi:MAG: hypothetical protein U0U66_10895 [Cytophagaceae bacterium]
MKRNTITSIINWWANSLPIYFFILLLSTTACKKKSDEFTVKQLATDGDISTFFTDTLTVQASTVFINDSLVTNKPSYLMFGNVQHPDAGVTQSEAYFRLTPYGLSSTRVDFTGAVVDSATLYFDYSYTVGDTTLSNTLSVHELTTALDPNFAYRANTSFVTYNSSALGTTTFTPKPNSKDSIRIALPVSFGQSLLNTLDDATSDEFVESFNGLMIKGNTNASVITANRSIIQRNDSVFYNSSLLIVYYKMAGVRKRQVFYFPSSSASFNKISSDKSGTLFAGLQNSGDELASVSTGNMVLSQAGTGTFIKLKFPTLPSLAPRSDSVIVINKAYLRMDADTTSMPNNPPVISFVLAELSATNELTFRGTLPAVVQINNYSQTGTGYAAYMNYDKTTGMYTGDITDYIQKLIFGDITSNGIALVPNVNSYFVNYTYASTLTPKPVRLELYYTIIKQ